jgi:hypothetical protein
LIGPPRTATLPGPGLQRGKTVADQLGPGHAAGRPHRKGVGKGRKGHRRRGTWPPRRLGTPRLSLPSFPQPRQRSKPIPPCLRQFRAIGPQDESNQPQSRQRDDPPQQRGQPLPHATEERAGQLGPALPRRGLGAAGSMLRHAHIAPLFATWLGTSGRPAGSLRRIVTPRTVGRLRRIRRLQRIR